MRKQQILGSGLLVLMMAIAFPNVLAAPGDAIRDRAGALGKLDRDSSPRKNGEQHRRASEVQALRRDSLRERDKVRRHKSPRAHHQTHYHHHRVGVRVNVLPPRHVTVHVSGQRYYYYGGVYYRPYGSTYVVVAAPVNAHVTVLPFGFVSFVIGPTRYYYINQTYYVYEPQHTRYVVVESPPGGEQAATEAVANTERALLIYPNLDQDQVTQDQDRYECHIWAMQESGFDPTQMEPQPDGERAQYRRAITMCLEARDYSVG